jgi:peptide chain release factor 2
VQRLETELSHPDVWNDQQRAKTLNTELSRFRRDVDFYLSLNTQLSDLSAAAELLEEDADDVDLQRDLQSGLASLQEALAACEFRLMLSGPNDRDSAIVSVHPGAGGTESQDWAQMLLRMYIRWAERKKYKTTILDYQPGEEAGLKSATLSIEGDFAYGYMRAEKGVHRLVRISPFDSNKRRHTSFASIDVVPDIEDEIEIEINDDDLRIDVFRASGAGGQHVNKTESAVRITHFPTNIVVQCQEDRSQLKNRANAMKVLKARLYVRAQEEKAEKTKTLYGEKMEIAFGSQIRSYVFHPYNMVKDHRTNHEAGDVQRVMDGCLDPFIESYLQQQSSES